MVPVSTYRPDRRYGSFGWSFHLVLSAPRGLERDSFLEQLGHLACATFGHFDVVPLLIALHFSPRLLPPHFAVELRHNIGFVAHICTLVCRFLKCCFCGPFPDVLGSERRCGHLRCCVAFFNDTCRNEQGCHAKQGILSGPSAHQIAISAMNN